MRHYIVAPDGARISTSDFDDLSLEQQHNFCEDHGIPLALKGDLSRYCSGIPAVYQHLQEYLADLNDGDDDD